MNNVSLPVYIDEPCSVTVDGQTYTLAEFGEHIVASLVQIVSVLLLRQQLKNTFQMTIKRNSLGLLRYGLLQNSFGCC